VNIQWFCENIYAKSGYSDEARVMIKSLVKKDFKIKIIGKNKKPDLREYEFQNCIDINLPIVFHTFRHGNYSPNTQQYTIVRTMLEVSRIPQNWVFRFNHMDEIWVPNMFNYETFQRSGVLKDKMFIIPSPVDFSFSTDRSVYKFRTNKKFIFFSLFNYENRDRKGLDILLKAYTEIFNKNADVCLVLKTKTTMEDLRKEYNLSKAIPEIEIINEVLDRRNLLSIYRAASCFVLPSRGEGIGRPYLDAMMTGLPIVATGWSGNRDFLNHKNSFLIDYKLIDVDKRYYLKYPGFFGAKWAEPDVNDLKNKMLLVVKDHKQAKNKIQESKNEVIQFKTGIVSNKLIDRFDNPLPKKKGIKNLTQVFERLMPLYYPDLKTKKDVCRINRCDFKKKIDSLLIVGSGYRARKVFDYFIHQAGIRRIFFLNEKLEPYSDMNLQALDLTSILNNMERIDIAVFAVNIKILKETYDSFISVVKSVPIYIFD